MRAPWRHSWTNVPAEHRSPLVIFERRCMRCQTREVTLREGDKGGKKVFYVDTNGRGTAVRFDCRVLRKDEAHAA